jgi:hypothetical protein
MPCRQVSTFNGTTGSGQPGGGGYATEADCLQACKEGACCEGTTCTVKPQCQCQGTEQVFKGVGTTCTPNPCVPCGVDQSSCQLITFHVSLSSFVSTAMLGVETLWSGGSGVSTRVGDCNLQYGFNSRAFSPQKPLGISQGDYDAGRVIVAQWASWLNSITATLTFDAQESAAKGALWWSGTSSSTTPSGSSSLIRFVAAFPCNTSGVAEADIKYTRLGGSSDVNINDRVFWIYPCFSSGPLALVGGYAFLGVTGANACNAASWQQTSFENDASAVVACALEQSSAGCASQGIEGDAFRGEFRGKVLFAVNTLP